MSSTRHKQITYGRKAQNPQGDPPVQTHMDLHLFDSSFEARRNASAKSEMTFFTAYDSGLSSVKSTASATTRSNLSWEYQKRNAVGSILQTPFPTEGSDSGVFKLGTSRPLPDTPGHRFSPVPLGGSREMISSTVQVYEGMRDRIPSRRLQRRTSSRVLKENIRPKSLTQTHISKFGASKLRQSMLDSPFTSRPASPTSKSVVHPAGKTIATYLDQNSRHILRPRHRQSLSDTRLNQSSGASLPGIRTFAGRHSPAPQNGRASPTQEIPIASFARHKRRPSAPPMRPSPIFLGTAQSALVTNSPGVARRGDVCEINLDLEASSPMTELSSAFSFLVDSGTYFLSSLGGAVDFNRPPSQLSLYGDEIDSDSANSGIFVHIRGRSTPNRSRPLSKNASPFPQPRVDTIAHDRLTTSGKDVAQSQQELDTKLYSSWITDSIISPPTYYKQQEVQVLSERSTRESTLEDMELTHPMSPLLGTMSDISSPDVVREDATGGYMKTTETREEAPQKHQQNGQATGVLIVKISSSPDHYGLADNGGASNQEKDENAKSSVDTASQNRQVPRFSRTRSGTIVPSTTSCGRLPGRRNRSGTIIQGGGGARRTRSGTVVQANHKEGHDAAGEPSESPINREDTPPETEQSLDKDCSCCSSDDELMLRSHSHYDLDAEELEWKVADPPSPVIKRLRRARRQNALRRRGRGKKGNPGAFIVVIEEDDGVEGDIDDDELDLLGTFVPEEW